MKSLVHNGLVFPPKYTPQNFKLIINGKIYSFSDLAEEMLYCYVSKLDRSFNISVMLDDKERYNNNFYQCLKQELTEEQRKLRFPYDFQPLFRDIKDYQIHAKPTKLEIDKTKFGYALVNDVKEPLGNYIVESPNIFIGRGDSIYSGYWKYRVNPEDVLINFISKTVEPPKPPYGKWRKVVSNPNITYVARYFVNIGMNDDKTFIASKAKEVRFSPSSSIIHKADLTKYDKAEALLKNWNKITDYITKPLIDYKNTDKKTLECALVSWLILYTSIRIGNDLEDYNTVGASTLLVNNIKLESTNNKYYLKLHFLGKDSIEYNQVFEVPDYIFKSLESLIKNKKPTDKIFDVSSSGVNKFLDNCLPNITAKVFRTAWAQRVLMEEYSLFKSKFDKTSVENRTLQLKLLILKVSKKLNHRKTDTTSLETKLNVIKSKIDKCTDEAKRKTLQLKYDYINESFGINVVTTLSNYINPVYVKKICNELDIPLTKIYTSSLIKRFNL